MVQALCLILLQFVTRHVHCHPPSEGIIKVNVDGYSFGNLGNAYYGDVLKVWEFGFIVFLELVVELNLLAELIAIWKGLSQLWI